MDEREEQARRDSLGICSKLYNFITRTLTSHALKTVTLGKASPMTPSGRGASSRWVQAVHPMSRDINIEGQSEGAIVGPEQAKHTSSYQDASHNSDAENRCCSPSAQLTEGEKPEEATRRAEAEVASEKRGPKKMVSINDSVEEIRLSRKGNRRNKPFVMPSLETEIDEIKPLKSILKVGSNLNAGV